MNLVSGKKCAQILLPIAITCPATFLHSLVSLDAPRKANPTHRFTLKDPYDQPLSGNWAAVNKHTNQI